MRKLLVIGFSALGVVAVGFVGLKLWIDGYSEVATLSCGESRSIKLSTSNFWDPLPDLYYQVYEGRRELLRYRSFVGCTEHDGDPRDLQYQCILSADHSVVGVVVQHDSDVVLALHDFGNSRTWPSNWNTPWEDHKRQATEMLAALQAAHSDRQLRLLVEVEPIGGRKSRKLPNKPAAPNAGIAPRLTIGHHGPRVGEPERSAIERKNTCME